MLDSAGPVLQAARLSSISPGEHMSRLHHLALYTILAAAAVLGAVRPVTAQTTTGSILGEVTDSSGGKLPGVTVTARNQENGASRETVTDALGSYSFSA